MKKALGLAAVLATAGLLLWLSLRKPAPPEVKFARVARADIASELSTNAKAEPREWAPVRASRAGMITSLAVERGQAVAAGAVLATLEGNDLRLEVESAQARLAEAQAARQALAAGGRPADTADIDGALARLRAERAAARRDLDAVERLLEKKAATRQEADQLRARLERLDPEIEALTRKRATLVTPADRAAAEARVEEARTLLEAARARLDQTVLRAPRAGVVYHLPVRAGAWLNAGDLLAEIGVLERLRILVYVDEPDLGRVRTGMPVAVTWDARPGRTWSGAVVRLPAQVTPLGSRQVGEVLAEIDNPGREIPPGANLNARLRAENVPGALAVPKAALRRDSAGFGVYVLEGNRVAWRAVTVGVSDVTKTQLVAGLKEGEAVALPGETPLKPGLEVTPVFP